MVNNKKFMIMEERSLLNKIYVIRGQQVMLDFEIAEIYGYTTTRFNEQVSRNIDKFDIDFMFELTNDEFQNLISQNATSSWGGRRKPPRAFTEQGIYMLMTVLRSERAIIQSKKLIRLFKTMKDYIVENRQIMITNNDYIKLAQKVDVNANDIQSIKNKLDTVITKADLTDFMRLFDSGIHHEEILLLDGEPFKADIVFQRIYSRAKNSLIIIDDYIGIKTLNLCYIQAFR